jgi:hypothetical protein
VDGRRDIIKEGVPKANGTLPGRSVEDYGKSGKTLRC